MFVGVKKEKRRRERYRERERKKAVDKSMCQNGIM